MEMEAFRGAKLELALKRLVDETIPAAVVLGLLPPRNAEEDDEVYLLRLFCLDEGDFDMRIAAELAGGSGLALKAAVDALQLDPDRSLDYLDGFAHRAAVNAARLDGMVEAEMRARKERTGPASAARSVQGDTKRRRVLAEVPQFRGAKSRRQAAIAIAAQLGLDTVLVERILLKEFRGQPWPPPVK